MTHSQLVNRAALWLRNTLHCSVVMKERRTATSIEIPDAIGWVGGRCILVECKTSVADFRADQGKAVRIFCAPALGDWRFYLTPPGLVAADAIQDGWGLYEVGSRVVHAAGARYSNAGAPPFKSDKAGEVALLVSAMRRLEIASTVFVRQEADGSRE